MGPTAAGVLVVVVAAVEESCCVAAGDDRPPRFAGAAACGYAWRPSCSSSVARCCSLSVSIAESAI